MSNATTTPTVSTIEEKLQTLIQEGKRDGYISYDRFNEIFPEECNSPDRIDEIFATLDGHGIEIREEPRVSSDTALEREEVEPPQEAPIEEAKVAREEEGPDEEPQGGIQASPDPHPDPA